jgi:hypothetical protein
MTATAAPAAQSEHSPPSVTRTISTFTRDLEPDPLMMRITSRLGELGIVRLVGILAVLAAAIVVPFLVLRSPSASAKGTVASPASGDHVVQHPSNIAATTHTITGTVTVHDFSSDVLDQVAEDNGYPTVSLSPYDTETLLNDRINFLEAVQAGKPFDCSNDLGGGYADMAQGAGVTVANGSGSVIATSSLGSGTMTSSGCRFAFTVSAPDASFYQITVSHRGALTYSESDLAAKDWTIASTLGDG